MATWAASLSGSLYALFAVGLTGFGLGARAQDDGEQLFRRTCGICHTVQPDQNRIGPSLAGIVGRKAGMAPGYNYSEANKDSNVTWDEANLDQYLTDPQKFMPGTKMIYAGMKDPSQRRAVIAYLKNPK